MRSAVQLLVPGLFDLPAHEVDPEFVRQRLPGLNRLLRYAAPRPNRRFTLDGIVRAALGLAGAPEASLPVAQALLENDELAGNALVAEAVHLHADLNSALLLPVPGNERNLTDIGILFKDLSDYFNPDCHLSTVSNGSYLMQLSSQSAPEFYPHLLSVLGKPANPYIEQSREALPWYRLHNEIQMFLHQHECNARRLADGLLPVNSLWCWGGGRRPESARAGRWYGEHALFDRLAAQLGMSVAATAAFAAAQPDGEPAVVLDLRLLQVLKGQREGELDGLLLALERELFEPALSLRGVELVLRAGGPVDYVYGPRSSLRFWRSEISLADCLAAQ